MKSKKFPAEIWTKIERALATEVQENSQPVAAFDADGTLWNTDLGEAFFQYQIDHCNFPGLPADPWQHYRNWKATGDPRPAYLWLAQINKGQSLQRVREWARKCVEKESPIPIFDEQKDLIKKFLDLGVKVYVVTASVKWAVEPGAALLGIPQNQVLGVQTKIVDGIITDQQEGAMTYREGKAEAILSATGGLKPFFCCGNTMGDFFLLSSASRLALAVSAAAPDEELFEKEEALFQEAKIKNWITYRF